jgi:hypothetical protein
VVANVTFAIHRVRHENQRPDDSSQPDAGLASRSQRLMCGFVQTTRPAEHAVRGKGGPENLPANLSGRPLIPQCPDSEHSGGTKQKPCPRPLIAQGLLLLIREDCNRHRQAAPEVTGLAKDSHCNTRAAVPCLSDCRANSFRYDLQHAYHQSKSSQGYYRRFVRIVNYRTGPMLHLQIPHCFATPQKATA